MVIAVNGQVYIFNARAAEEKEPSANVANQGRNTAGRPWCFFWKENQRISYLRGWPEETRSLMQRAGLEVAIGRGRTLARHPATLQKTLR